MRTFLSLVADRSTLVGGAQVSAIVGTVLNAINQGDRLIALRFDDVVWWRVGLTYLVPFCVSVFSATRIRRIDQSSREAEAHYPRERGSAGGR